MQIFLSYRRDDSADATGRIFDRLRADLGPQVVFRDVDAIPLGHDFRAVIRRAVQGCSVLLAVIGPTWLGVVDDDGRRRLDDPDDFVRLEIEAALARDLPVVPVLVGRARMPKAGQLPEGLRPLAYRNGIEVRRDPDFHRDMDRLVRGLAALLDAPPGSPRREAGPPELRVVVLGEFNRGKSTLINALLGKLVLPARLIPSTGLVTRLVYGAEEQVRVRFRDGRRETFELQQLDSLTSLDRDGDGLAREDVELVEVAVDAALLRRGIVVYDTPGLNNTLRVTERAMQAVAHADLVLLMLDARALPTRDERQLVVKLAAASGKPLVLVVNYWNLVGAAEKAGLRAELAHLAREVGREELGRPWFEVDALGALKHALGRGGPPGDDTAALGAALAALTDTQRAHLQRRAGGRTGAEG